MPENCQCSSQGQAWTFEAKVKTIKYDLEAKAWTFEAKAKTIKYDLDAKTWPQGLNHWQTPEYTKGINRAAAAGLGLPICQHKLQFYHFTASLSNQSQ